MDISVVMAARWSSRWGLMLIASALILCAASTISRGVAADGSSSANSPAFTAEQIQFYEKEVRPILKANCLECHGGQKKIKGGLRLTSRASILKGGDTGPAISLDKPSESLLLEAINYQDLEMPPKGKLPAEQIDILTRWVKMGAPLPPSDVANGTKPETQHAGPPQVNDENRQFWSFQPVHRPELPQGKTSAWVKSPIDAFILARLENAKISPATPAGKAALLRRAYYDLTGLPPEPADVDAFLADNSPRAFENVVDRLLDSPQYGEQWARHWLDLVRYAETNSYERDDPKPFVWRYRDYVIRSFNDDKPYDQFVREQLAGDESDRVTPESIIATGYYRIGIWDDEPTDHELAFYDDMDDILSTTGQVFLGLTIGCARCHDHKLDPIPQSDYYRMLAFLRNVRRYGVRAPETVLEASVRTIATPDEQRQHEQLTVQHKAKLQSADEQLAAIESSVRDKLVGGEKDDFQDESSRVRILKKHVPADLSPTDYDRYEALTQQRDELRKNPPPGLTQALCIKENGPTAPPTYVLIRGNSQAKGDEVAPGVPAILEATTPQLASIQPTQESTGRRRALADWIANDKNPLTARVMANRIWQYHFGRGLVRSSNNFGLQGTPPTHPELLDWLASELIDDGWRLKRLQKTIMMSSAYQMSSHADAVARRRDPENDLFHSFDMRRLSAEEVRDSMLAVNGSLNRQKMFGPSIYPVIPQEVLHGQSRPGYGWQQSSPEDRARRSVYIHVKRSLLVPILESFDAADPDATCPVRFSTTQPTQALGLLNSEFANEEARTFASSVGFRSSSRAR
ncbi:MAG: PSD1 and planctomycete cytochrome C domain-containing protein, partial [Planctomycetaceae bacterium]